MSYMYHTYKYLVHTICTLRKKNLSDTRTDGRGKLHVYSILMEQTDNN